MCYKLGYGSSAVVYNAIYKPKNMRIAIKMIDLDLFERNQIDELRVKKNYLFVLFFSNPNFSAKQH